MSSPQRLAIGDAELAFEIVGDGPIDLVFLHEGLGSIELWRRFPRDVTSGVGGSGLVYDRRGHGRSSPSVGERTASYLHESALEELPQILTRFSLERPVLIGHSDGATIALIHAAHHAIGGLVLIAPHVSVEEAATTGIARTDLAADSLITRLDRYHDGARELYTAWRDIWLDAAFASWNIEDEIRGVSVPMMLIQGSEDEYGTLDQLDRIEHAATGPTERVVIRGAGHSPHLSHPSETTVAVVDFIDRLRIASSRI